MDIRKIRKASSGLRYSAVELTREQIILYSRYERNGLLHKTARATEAQLSCSVVSSARLFCYVCMMYIYARRMYVSMHVYA